MEADKQFKLRDGFAGHLERFAISFCNKASTDKQFTLFLSCGFPEYYTQTSSEFLLKLHSFASLYGWNLSGLAVNMQV